MNALKNANVAKLVLVVTVVLSVFLGARIGLGNRYDEVMDVWYNGADDDLVGVSSASWMKDRVSAAYNIELVFRTAGKSVAGLNELSQVISEMQLTDDPRVLLEKDKELENAMSKVYLNRETVLAGAELEAVEGQWQDFMSRGDILSHDDYRVLANEYNQLLKKFPASLLWRLVGLERAPV